MYLYVYNIHMRTNIEIDRELLLEAKKYTKLPTMKAVINEGLKVLVMLGKRKSLFELQSKIKFAPGYDYKSLR